MVNIKEFNTQVYNFLKALRENNTSLRYTYRKSNYGGRLDDGYWFYGNEDYLAVSFWSGMDWKNRTPNIYFVFTSRGEAKLEISVTDSDLKKSFVEEQLLKQLELAYDGRTYYKIYGFEEYAGIDLLNIFINGFNGEQSDKSKIDDVINQFSKVYFGKDDNAINYIDPREFRSREIKINKYLQLQDQESRERHEASQKPSRLKSIRIKNYQDIKDTCVNDIPQETQWIFITGENGAGKTSLLKAISMAMGFKLMNKTELKHNTNFEVNIQLYKGKTTESYDRVKNEGCTSRFPLVSGLAVFGPNRLINNKDSPKKKPLATSLKKEESFDSLWKYEYRMIDIEDQFDEWSKGKKGSKDELEKRKYYIRTLLSRVVPGIYDVRFKEGKSRTKYIIRKDESSSEEAKDWQQLPSGTRSVFALVSEMLVRLNHYQKDVIDPSEFKGIVVIDEIDLHLHPKAQKELIISLTEAFKSVQFIVATHSPIPLLGAPLGSVFIRTLRHNEEGVIMERLKDIEKNIGNLLPNVLYTSGVFGMHDLISVANRSKSEVLTADTMEEANELIELKRKFNVNDNDLDK